MTLSRFNTLLSAAFVCLVIALSAGLARAQGRPDLVWERSGGIAGTSGNPQYSLAYSPDGTTVAASDRFTTRLWRVADGMLLRTLFSEPHYIAFSRDGKSIIGADGTSVRFWSALDGNLLKTVGGLSGTAASIAVSADGGTIAIGLFSGYVELRSAATGALIAILGDGSQPIISLAYSPDGKWLVGGGGAGYLTSTLVWNAFTNALAYSTPLAEYANHNVAISADSRFYYAEDGNYSIGVYDLLTGQEVNGYNFGQVPMYVATSPDGKVAISAGFNGGATVHIWQSSDLTDQPTVQSWSGGGAALAFSPDAGSLVMEGISNDITSQTTGLSLWQVDNGAFAFIKRIAPNNYAPYNNVIAVSGNGQVVASVNASVQIQRPTDGSTVASIPDYTASAVALSPDGSMVVEAYSGGSGNMIAVRQVANQALVWSIPAPVSTFGGINLLLFSPDGSKIYAGGGSGPCSVLSAVDGSIITQLPPCSWFSLSGDGSRIATGEQNSVSIYNTGDWSLAQTISYSIYNNQFPGAYALSPDGTLLIESIGFSNGDSRLVLWDVASASTRFDIATDAPASSIAFSPDGQVVATSDGNLNLRFRSVADGAIRIYYNDETTSTMWLTFSPDGNFLYYGRNDGTVCCAKNPTNQIIDVTANASGPSTATITWITTSMTDVPCELDYGLTTSYGSSVIEGSDLSHVIVVGGVGWVHTIKITGLQANSGYHFRIIAYGSPNYTSGDYTVATPVGLGITNIGTVGIGAQAAEVTWNTNLPANSTVQYGTSVAYGSNAASPALTTSHSMSLSGLSPSTLYHYRVSSTDANGNTQVSADQTFVTTAIITGSNGSFSYTLTRQTDGTYLVTVTLTEVDYHEIGQDILFATTLDFAALGAAGAPTSGLPNGFGTITPGNTGGPVSLVFPASAGAPGTRVNLRFTASYLDSLGNRLSINSSFRGVQLP